MASTEQAASNKAARVWKMEDLHILHQLPKPVIVVMHETVAGMQDSTKIVFQNDLHASMYGHASPGTSLHLDFDQCTEETLRQRQEHVIAALQSEATVTTYWSAEDVAKVYQNFCPHLITSGIRLDSKPIHLEISPGNVQSGTLGAVEVDEVTPVHRRGSAIHDYNPMHTFMFDSDGRPLFANKAAVRGCLADPEGSGQLAADVNALTLKAMFYAGEYKGGRAEAQSAYEEALNAIFSLKLDCHRHTQPHKSKKDGRMKWAMIEMWPMMDPVSERPAVLVKRYNISQQKELELQLSVQQVALQRQNQALEQDSAAMSQEKERLQQEADSLAQRLEAVMHDKFNSRTSFDADTPIDKTLSFLQSFIAGKVPSVQRALHLYHILSESNTNLRQPIGLETQLLQSEKDTEVGRSMLQLLQGRLSGVPESPRVRTPRRMGVPDFHLAVPETPTGRKRGFAWRDEGILLHDTGVMEHIDSGSDMDSTMSVEAKDDLVIPSITPVIERYLQDAENNWQFDIFGFAEAAKGHALSMLTFHLVKATGQMEERSYDATKFARYTRKIESGYLDTNPYHNSVHVASVVQMTHMILCHGGVMKCGAMDRVQHMASYWSALVHDYEHGGLNNDFLIKTYHPLAITYNDQSPLENHHAAAAARLFACPELQYHPVDPAFADERLAIRSCCMTQVLGTDMKKHFDISSRFQAAYKRVSASSLSGEEADRGSPAVDWASIKAEDKTLVHQMVLKCADIGHLAASTGTHKRWAYQLEEEFFRQGDKEHEFGLPVSPLMDRSQSGGMTRSQLGFYSIVGVPLFKAMTEIFEDCQPMLEGVLANQRYWEEAAKEAPAADAAP